LRGGRRGAPRGGELGQPLGSREKASARDIEKKRSQDRVGESQNRGWCYPKKSIPKRGEGESKTKKYKKKRKATLEGLKIQKGMEEGIWRVLEEKGKK